MKPSTGQKKTSNKPASYIPQQTVTVSTNSAVNRQINPRPRSHPSAAAVYDASAFSGQDFSQGQGSVSQPQPQSSVINYERQGQNYERKGHSPAPQPIQVAQKVSLQQPPLPNSPKIAVSNSSNDVTKMVQDLQRLNIDPQTSDPVKLVQQSSAGPSSLSHSGSSSSLGQPSSGAARTVYQQPVDLSSSGSASSLGSAQGYQTSYPQIGNQLPSGLLFYQDGKEFSLYFVFPGLLILSRNLLPVILYH